MKKRIVRGGEKVKKKFVDNVNKRGGFKWSMRVVAENGE
jgi:hypothetical protein